VATQEVGHTIYCLLDLSFLKQPHDLKTNKDTPVMLGHFLAKIGKN